MIPMMEVGKSIIDYAVTTGDLKVFIAAGFDEKWLNDKRRGGSWAAFTDTNLIIYRFLLEHYQRHGKAPDMKLFGKNFPAYVFDDVTSTAGEIIEAAAREVRAELLLGMAEEIKQFDSENDIDGSAEFVSMQSVHIRDMFCPVDETGGFWWDPADWYDGKTEDVPTIGMRSDEVYLFYPGKTHAVTAETEAGKSWLALLVCAQEIEKGNDVGFIDFEDNGPGIYSRLVEMLPWELIAKHFHYHRADAPLPRDFATRYCAGMTVVFFDGVGEALQLHGWKSDEDGVLAFGNQILRPVAALGAAASMLDHFPKDRNNQNDPLGSVYKTNSISGASYILRNVVPFGKGRTGYSTLEVRKDRAGNIRKEGMVTGKRCMIAELHITSVGTAKTLVELKPPVNPEEPRQWNMKRKISEFMVKSLPVSKNEIAKNVDGKKEDILTAVDDMVADGFLGLDGSGTYKKVKFIKPWQEEF